MRFSSRRGDSQPLSDLTELYVERSEALAEQGAWDLCVVWLERAVSYAPENPHAWLRLAAALEKCMRHAEAVGAAGKALSSLNCTEERFEALSIIMRCCLELNDAESALKACIQRIRLRPDEEDAWTAFAHVGMIAAASDGVLDTCIAALHALRDG